MSALSSWESVIVNRQATVTGVVEFDDTKSKLFESGLDSGSLLVLNNGNGA